MTGILEINLTGFAVVPENAIFLNLSGFSLCWKNTRPLLRGLALSLIYLQINLTGFAVVPENAIFLNLSGFSESDLLSSRAA
jgi:hypothetical protein